MFRSTQSDVIMRKNLLFCFVLSAALVVILWHLYFFQHIRTFSYFQWRESSPPKIIVGYTPFFSKNMSYFVQTWSEPYCDFDCIFSDDKLLVENASMVLFHGRDVDPEHLPLDLTDDQIKTFIILESPSNTRLRKETPSDFFDLFVSYRRDSDVQTFYDAFLERVEDDATNYMNYTVWDQREVHEIVANKSELILQFVSNCKTHSKREVYLAEMEKHINVTVVGRCGNKTRCDRNVDCERELIKSHFFYLAFENSICEEYVTEKFFRMKELIVPVVLKRSVVEGIAPAGSFIAADDFKSPQELVDFLEQTAGNPEKYLQYFDWTKKYYKSEIRSKMSCQLCEIAWKGIHKPSKKRDILRLWSTDQCQSRFAQRLLG